jgi:outer membrane lipoprotein SlyB
MESVMRLLIALAFAGAVAGCASHPDPIIDMRGVDQKQFAQDWKECDAYSEEVRVASGAAKGAATGAAVGAVAGAISGDVSDSAAYGGLYGGTRSGLDADRQKQMVFKRCMSGRGYRVLN